MPPFLTFARRVLAKSAWVFTVAGPSLLPAQVWTWNSVDLTVLKRGGTELVAHARGRSRDGDWQQGRLGAIARQGLTSRINAVAGYYYGREEDVPDEWRAFHRVFAGAELRLLRQGPWTLQFRSLVERLMPRERADLFRFRERLRLTSGWRVGPFAGAEWFFDRRGYSSARYSAGVRWRMAGWSTLEAGYLFDARRPRIGQDRHVIVTQWSIQPWD